MGWKNISKGHEVSTMKLEKSIELMKREEGVQKIQQRMRFIQNLDKLILKRKHIKIADTLLIIGTPRSGTSWLMEIFESISGYTYLFEPLNPIFFPETVSVGFQSRPYIPPDKPWGEGEEYLRKAFTGGIFSHLSPYWFKPRNLMHRLLGNKLIVKSVRMNRLLPWIVNRFTLRSIIFIIRHPCAVIASQCKTGFYGYHAANPPYMNIIPIRGMILQEARQIDGLEKKILDRLKAINTQEEVLAAAWCLDNYIPLSSTKPYPWITVIYEKITTQGEKEINRIMSKIGVQKIPPSVFRYLKVPSMLTLEKERKMVKKADVHLGKWKTALSEKQIERILKVVSIFGLDFYNEDIEPDYEQTKNLY